MYKQKWVRLILAILLLSLISVWTLLTPHGLDGKLEAAGFSVCHQIGSHSLTIGDKLLPLCARCTGMYLGTLVGLMILFSKNKTSGSPTRMKTIVLGFFLLLFTVDGVNSMLSTFLSLAPLYPPSNLLRLITGFLMGIILANLIVPLWNQTLWKESDTQPVMGSWRQLASLMLCEAVVGLLIWLDIPLLYYPIAILSTGTIFLILGMVYTLLWCIILNKENTLESY